MSCIRVEQSIKKKSHDIAKLIVYVFGLIAFMYKNALYNKTDNGVASRVFL